MRSAWFVVAALILPVYCLWFISFGASESFEPDWEHQHRFQTDNAVGATANAVEHLAESRPGGFVHWAIVALLCVLIHAVYEVGQHIVDYMKWLHEVGHATPTIPPGPQDSPPVQFPRN